MKINFNPNRNKCGLGIIALIIFVIALFVVVGTMVYLIYKLAKKLNAPPPPPDPTSAQIVGEYGYMDDVYVTSQVSLTSTNIDSQTNSVISAPKLSITNFTGENGESVNVLNAGEYEVNGPFDLVYERSTNMVNWEPFNTNTVLLDDIIVINTYGEISYTNEIVSDTNMHPCMFYRAFIRPL